MKKYLPLLLGFFTFTMQSTYGQHLIASPKSSTITAKKINGINLVIPIEVDFVNPSTTTLTSTITIQIDNTTAAISSQFSSTDITNVKIINDNQTLIINGGETKKGANVFSLPICTGRCTKSFRTMSL